MAFRFQVGFRMKISNRLINGLDQVQPNPNWPDPTRQRIATPYATISRFWEVYRPHLKESNLWDVSHDLGSNCTENVHKLFRVHKHVEIGCCNHFKKISTPGPFHLRVGRKIWSLRLWPDDVKYHIWLVLKMQMKCSCKAVKGVKLDV